MWCAIVENRAKALWRDPESRLQRDFTHLEITLRSWLSRTEQSTSNLTLGPRANRAYHALTRKAVGRLRFNNFFPNCMPGASIHR
jgi:hypothetical protein